MKTPFAFSLGIYAGLILLAGCTVTDSRIGADSRAGYISEIYSRDKLRTDPPSCLRPLTEAQRNNDAFVEIMIHHGRRHEYLSARVPQGMTVQLHDEVEFSPKHCESGAIPEIKQVLVRHK